MLRSTEKLTSKFILPKRRKRAAYDASWTPKEQKFLYRSPIEVLDNHQRFNVHKYFIPTYPSSIERDRSRNNESSPFASQSISSFQNIAGLDTGMEAVTATMSQNTSFLC
jgi:hypothetical protein